MTERGVKAEGEEPIQYAPGEYGKECLAVADRHGAHLMRFASGGNIVQAAKENGVWVFYDGT